jgi:hypothetical protein
VVFTREFWTWASRRAGIAALLAAISVVPLTLDYTQVRLVQAVVIAGITGLLSLLTSLATRGSGTPGRC